jgi:hypothetical protein
MDEIGVINIGLIENGYKIIFSGKKAKDLAHTSIPIVVKNFLQCKIPLFNLDTFRTDIKMVADVEPTYTFNKGNADKYRQLQDNTGQNIEIKDFFTSNFGEKEKPGTDIKDGNIKIFRRIKFK